MLHLTSIGRKTVLTCITPCVEGDIWKSHRKMLQCGQVLEVGLLLTPSVFNINQFCYNAGVVMVGSGSHMLLVHVYVDLCLLEVQQTLLQDI